MKRKIIIMASILIVTGVILGIIFYVNSDAVNIKKQLDLGQKYLTELDYEQAAASFLGVLEIDDRNVDAYLGLAEAYAGMGDRENAAATLEKGIALTDDESLKTYLKELQEQWALEDAPKEPEEAVEETKKTVVNGGGRFVGVNRDYQYENCIVAFSDDTSSELVPVVEIVMGKLDVEDAKIMKELFDGRYSEEQFVSELSSKIICPVCGQSCVYLCAAGGGNSENYCYSLLEYCDACEQICAIGYEGEMLE